MLPNPRLLPRVAAFALLAVLFAAPAHAQLPAFPGAEGAGALATGGRGGEVYIVTNLEDSGPGSLREAVSQPNRTVVFEVGGIIPLTTRIVVARNVTIAGQTAPGEGITVYGQGVSFSNASDAIVRHIRFRMGIGGGRGHDAVGIALGERMIFDHVSISWGRDENFSVTSRAANVTIQNSIIAQGLDTHSCGGLMEPEGLTSVLRNLYHSNHTRNPKVKGFNQFVNNVVYNWRVAGYILGDSAGKSEANVVGNYFINGPETRSPAFTRGNENFRLYAADNWQDADRDGQLNGHAIPPEDYGVVTWVEQPFNYPAIETVHPELAYRLVASQAGPYLQRDRVDRILIDQLTSLGKEGSIIRDENDAPMNGPGPVAGGEAPADTDRDGMPDYWELAMGHDPLKSDHHEDANGDGYTNLEGYLNFKASPHAAVAAGSSVEIDLRRYTSGFARGAKYGVSAIEGGTAELLGDGHIVRFSTSAEGRGLVGLDFSVIDGEHAHGGRVQILVTPPAAQR
jgi:pectate lyase